MKDDQGKNVYRTHIMKNNLWMTKDNQRKINGKS